MANLEQMSSTVNLAATLLANDALAVRFERGARPSVLLHHAVDLLRSLPDATVTDWTDHGSRSWVAVVGGVEFRCVEFRCQCGAPARARLATCGECGR